MERDPMCWQHRALGGLSGSQHVLQEAPFWAAYLDPPTPSCSLSLGTSFPALFPKVAGASWISSNLSICLEGWLVSRLGLLRSPPAPLTFRVHFFTDGLGPGRCRPLVKAQEASRKGGGSQE